MGGAEAVEAAEPVVVDPAAADPVAVVQAVVDPAAVELAAAAVPAT
jgi:hypothetical protein